MADLNPTATLQSAPSPSALLTPVRNLSKEVDEKLADVKRTQEESDKKKSELAAKDTSGELYKDIQPVLDRVQKSMSETTAPTTQRPEYKETNPLEAWSSPAMMVAMIGSIFTRTPMISALNAASATMKAYKDRDAAEFERHFKTWQADMSQYEKNLQEQQKIIQWATAEKDRRKGLNDREQRDVDNATKIKLQSIFKQIGDKTALATLEQKGVDETLNYVNRRTATEVAVLKSQYQVEEERAAVTELMKKEASPEWQTMTPKEKTDFRVSLNPKYGVQLKRAQLSASEQIVKAAQATPEGKQYMILSTVDTIIDNAEKEIGSNKPALRGSTTNALVDSFARAVGGGVARKYLVQSLKVNNANLDQYAEEKIGKFDPEGGGMSSSQAQQLIDTMKSMRETSKQSYTDAIERGAAAMDQTIGGGDVLKTQAGVGNHVERGAPTSSGKVPPDAAIEHLRKNPGTIGAFAKYYNISEDQARSKYLHGGPAGKQPDTFR